MNLKNKTKIKMPPAAVVISALKVNIARSDKINEIMRMDGYTLKIVFKPIPINHHTNTYHSPHCIRSNLVYGKRI